jgi:hypothetical protein
MAPPQARRRAGAGRGAALLAALLALASLHAACAARALTAAPPPFEAAGARRVRRAVLRRDPREHGRCALVDAGVHMRAGMPRAAAAALRSNPAFFRACVARRCRRCCCAGALPSARQRLAAPTSAWQSARSEPGAQADTCAARCQRILFVAQRR